MDSSYDPSKMIKIFQSRIKQASRLIEFGNYDEAISELEKIKDEAKPYNIPQISSLAEKSLNDAQMFRSLSKLFKVSSRLKIDDISNLLKRSRMEILEIFMDWGEKFGVNIDGDFISVQNTDNLDSMMSNLKQTFDDWSDKENTKEGKISQTPEPSMNSSANKKFEMYISQGDHAFVKMEYIEASEQYNEALNLAKNELFDPYLINNAKHLLEKSQNMIAEEGKRNIIFVENGQIAFQNGEYEKSIENFNRSIEICKRLRWQDGIRYANEMIAKCTHELNKPINYHGSMLVKPEYNCMMELEKMVGQPIPALSENEIDYDTFGFFASNNHVIGLGIYDKKLSSLPESIGSLKSLTRLDLDHNELSSLPETIGSLTSLKTLMLYNNKISSLPETIGSLTSLTVLYLGKNNLSSLPETIGSLTALKELYLYENRLTSLPESIGLLKSLTTLDLNYNSLSSLPETIGSLTSLTNLDLGGNQITSLPGTIKKWLGDLKKKGCYIYR